VAGKYKSTTALASKRRVDLQRMGHTLQVIVQGASTEWELRYWVALKNRAIGFRVGLGMLPFETWLFQGSTSHDTAAPADMLKSMHAARSCAAEMLRGDKTTCLEDMKKILSAQSAMLLSLDRSFRI
jgi:hypothetical protein